MATKRGAMLAEHAAPAPQPHNPISRPRIEIVISRSVAIFGLLFGAQSAPAVLSQLPQVQPVWALVFVVAIFGGILVALVASFAFRFVRSVNAFIAFAYLAALVAWPFATTDSSAVSNDRPWLWLICTVATSTAAVAFKTWQATVYLIVTPIVYGVVRMTPSGGGKAWGSAALDTAYAIILGGAVLILITMLRQAAASVDAAQAAALERYAHAVRQHATEVERVQVDSIVHDSVLATLLSAATAYTPEAKALATRMALNSMGHLKDAAAALPDDDATVSMDQLAHRIMGATSTLAAPFELRTHDIDSGVVPVQSAEAVYSAAVQAMVNSLRHAGSTDDVRRWLEIDGSADRGIRVVVGDNGEGFAPDAVPAERLGLRVSIIERVAHAGGMAEVDSVVGGGTIITIAWPHPEHAPTLAVADAGEQAAR